MANQNKMK